MQVPDKSNCKLFLIACIALFSSCDIINPADPIPSYVHIDQIIVDPVSGTGTSRQQFTEAWVYLNDDLIGAYSVPSTFPLIASGEAELLIFPGIRVNGIQAAADFYPFFEPHTITASLTLQQVLDIEVRTRYRSNIAIPLIEDFESSHRLTDDIDEDAATFVDRITDAPFEGVGSGRIYLDDNADFIQVATVPLLNNLPTNGTPVYLEMHYKNNVEFSVGLVGHEVGFEPASVSILILREQEDWNKVYVELAPALQASQLAAYQILITAAHDTSLLRSEIFLDNLKVVHIAQ